MKSKALLMLQVCIMIITIFSGGTVYAANGYKPIIPLEYDLILPSSDGKFLSVQKNGKWGLIDTDGIIVLSIEYDAECRSIGDGIYAVGIEGKEAVVDADGKFLLPPVFDRIFKLFDGENTESSRYVYGLKDGRGTITDMKGEDVTPSNENFSDIQVFGDTVILMKVENPFPTVSVPFFTLYNLERKEIISPEDCQYIAPIGDEAGFTIATWPVWETGVDGTRVLVEPARYSVVNREGQIIVPDGIYSEIGGFLDGVAPSIKDGKLVLIDESGVVTAEFEGDYSGSSIEYHGNSVIILRKENLYGMLNMEGAVIIPFEYSWMRYDSGRVLAQTNNGDYLLNKEGKILARGAVFRHDNEVIVTDSAMYTGDGTVIVPTEKYDRIFSNTAEQFVYVEKNGKTGVVDISGNELYPCELASVGQASERSQIIFNEQMKPALLDISGEVAVAFGKYPFIYSILPSGFITVGDSDGIGHVGLINADGKPVIPCAFDDIAELPGGYLLAFSGYSKSVYDINGKLIIPKGTYDDIISIYYDGEETKLIAVKKSGKWGVVNLP